MHFAARRRVVGNYHVCNYKAKRVMAEARSPASRAAAAAAQGSGSQDPYETEEHLSVGVPGMGMRISVSSQVRQACPRRRTPAGWPRTALVGPMHMLVCHQ